MALSDALTIGNLSSHSGLDGSFKKWSHVKAMTASSLLLFWIGSAENVTCSFGIYHGIDVSNEQLKMRSITLKSAIVAVSSCALHNSKNLLGRELQ